MHITANDMIGALRKVVAEAGEDYVYPANLRDGGDGRGPCMYQVNLVPACIVGRALHSLGVTGEQLKLVEHNPAEDAIRKLKDHEVLTYDWEIGEIAHAAQTVQDYDNTTRFFEKRENTWGAALAAAEIQYDMFA